MFNVGDRVVVVVTQDKTVKGRGLPYHTAIGKKGEVVRRGTQGGGTWSAVRFDQLVNGLYISSDGYAIWDDYLELVDNAASFVPEDWS